MALPINQSPLGFRVSINNTRELESQPAGARIRNVGFQPANRKLEADSTLQLDGFDFADEAGCVVFQERADDVEHGVTEAADVQDVVSLGCLAGSIGLDVDADQLWIGNAVSALDLLELLPLRHR